MRFIQMVCGYCGEEIESGPEGGMMYCDGKCEDKALSRAIRRMDELLNEEE